MKQCILRGLLACALTLSTVSQAADITITVKGRVVANACTVSVPNTTVELGDLYASDFAKAGSASSWHDANLSLTNCPTGTSRVRASFSGTADSAGYFKNQGTAENMLIELRDSDGTTIKSGGYKEILVNDSTRTALFPLQVRALSVDGNATQGSIKTVINVVYTYY